MKSSLKTVRVVHTQVIDKAKKLEIENINFINGGLAAEVSIIVDELEFYGCRIWRDEAGRAASVVSVPEIINFRTARCAVPVIKVSEKIKHAIAVMADDILQKVKPCRYDQTTYSGGHIEPPTLRADTDLSPEQAGQRPTDPPGVGAGKGNGLYWIGGGLLLPQTTASYVRVE